MSYTLFIFVLLIFIVKLNASLKKRRWSDVDSCDIGEVQGSLIKFFQQDFETKLCLGTLLNPLYVLTSARCITKDGINYNEHIRVAHMYLEGELFIDKIFVHPKFVGFPYVLNDISVVKLNETLTENQKYYSYIKLPEPTCSSPILGICKMGYGVTPRSFINNPPCPRLQIITKSQCQEQLLSDFVTNKPIGHQMCTISNSTAICKGDEGAPLMCNKEQIGVFSFGNYKRPCGSGEYPAVFTRVDCHLKFIYSTILESGGKEYLDENKVSKIMALNIDYPDPIDAKVEDEDIYKENNSIKENNSNGSKSDGNKSSSSKTGQKHDPQHNHPGASVSRTIPKNKLLAFMLLFNIYLSS